MNDFSLKDFFAFEMAREIGLFDEHIDTDKSDFDSIKQQMIFIFFYLSLLIVIERTLFNFDDHKFMREQIIFELKRGVSNLNKLDDLLDYHVCDSDFFDKVISEVASVRKNKSSDSNSSGDQGVSFDLKEGIEVNLISAINNINDEKSLMNNEISKHPNKILNIQKFEPEETLKKRLLLIIISLK